MSRSENNLVYMRQRSTDGAFASCWKLVAPLARMPRKRRVKALSLLVTAVILLVIISSANVGYTVSYFNDTENSTLNRFVAGLLDFLVGPDNTIHATVTATTTALILPVMTPEGGSLPTLYDVSAEEVGGVSALCSAIVGTATTSPFIYSGDLLALVTTPTTTSGTWDLGLTLSTIEGFYDGDECDIDLVYHGWYPDAAPNTGFTDEERVHLILTYLADTDPFDVVLNEFLPHPDGVAYGFDFGNDSSAMPQGEWVEFYNKGSAAQDMAGWYVSDASGGVGNTIISSSNTNTGDTIIAGHGWLVVYFNKAVLNNTGDEIHLFSPGGVEVDSVTYNNPSDACFLEPTPGDENSTSTPTGTPGNGNNADCIYNQVAPNKSYARVPDGTGVWVDPIPTPGITNIPDLETLSSIIKGTYAFPTIAESSSESSVSETEAETMPEILSTPPVDEATSSDVFITETASTTPDATTTETETAVITDEAVVAEPDDVTNTDESVSEPTPTAPAPEKEESVEALPEPPATVEKPSEPASEPPPELTPEHPPELQSEPVPETPAPSEPPPDS